MWQNKIRIFTEYEMDRANVEHTIHAQAIYVETELDKLGEEGWEPYSYNDGEGEAVCVFVLKRWVAE